MYNPVKLPYSYSALEPYIDSETMNVHYNRHYMTYLNNLNDEIKKYKLNKKIPIKKLIANIKKFSTSVRNNAGGYFNHSLFWYMLKPVDDKKENLPEGIVQKVIVRDFGSYANFKKKISDTAKKRFGSGWVWWILLPNGKTKIVQTPYQDNPKMFYNCDILLGIDVWEHAYYLKYKSDRAKYVENIFKLINWNYPEKVLQSSLNKKIPNK